MPSIPEHYDQSLHNIEFSSVFPQNQYADWAITSRFYAAAHLIRAWLLRFSGVSSQTLRTHKIIDEELTRLRFDRAMHIAYRDLLALSKSARYDCVPVSVLAADIADAQSHYEKIRDFINPYLSSYLPSS